MRKYVVSLALLTLLLLPAAFSQTPESADCRLVYADNERLVSVTGGDGKALSVTLGMSLPALSVIKTGDTAAELQLVPNGSILKIAPNTVFVVDAIAGRDPGSANGFKLVSGKIRMVAAHIAATSAMYTIRTPTAVGGVRGTDFAMMVRKGQYDWLFVQDGLVDFTKIDPVTGKEAGKLQLKAGEFADAVAPVFQVGTASAASLKRTFSDLQFVKLDPAQVPGNAPAATAPAAPAQQPEAPAEAPGAPAAPQTAATEPAQAPSAPAAPAPEAAPGAAEQPAPAATAPAPAKQPRKAANVAPPPAEPVPAETDKTAAGAKPAGSGQTLGDILGFEVGSITISGTTYAKAVIQPRILTDSFRLGLYLPVIYSNDLFNPSDWYQPKGNNEWSFGTDQKGALNILSDLGTDLMLKIKYLEIGNQGSDPFFLKVGNLETLTLGHGSLMKNFSNNQDFPAIRRLGLSTGFKTPNFALETVFDDVSDLQVMGARVAGGAGMFEMGVSAVADLDVAADYNTDPVANPYGNYGKPALIAAGVDLQLFRFDLGILSGLGFADAATVMPYFREQPASVGAKTIDTGLHYDMAAKNYLVTAGVYGKLLAFLDYDLEYRFTQGLARPSLFDGTYNRNKTDYLDSVMGYLDGTTTDDVDGQTTMGLYGSLGADILGIARFSGGYYWPWSIRSGGGVVFGENDNLALILAIPKGKIPVVKLSGSLQYQRTNFAPTVAAVVTGKEDKGVSLFDANTVFGGELVYGLVEGMDLAVNVFTAVVRDDSGEVRFENGQPMIRPSISIETRISF